jgi:carbon-monoxide dehydrogenase iron sulfur subunit
MKRIYINERVCIGCHLCEVYCTLQHSKSRDLVKAYNRESPKPLPRVRIEEKKPVSFSVRCHHCAEPACVYACLSGALTKDPETGVVSVDEEKCIGCWTCVLACPYGAIKQDKEQHHIIKCDLCKGLDKPICVANCPNEALIYRDGDTPQKA